MNSFRAIIVWHYYQEGKIVDYGITDFFGNRDHLLDSLRNNEFGERKNSDRKKGDIISVLHDVIML